MHLPERILKYDIDFSNAIVQLLMVLRSTKNYESGEVSWQPHFKCSYCMNVTEDSEQVFYHRWTWVLPPSRSSSHRSSCFFSVGSFRPLFPVVATNMVGCVVSLGPPALLNKVVWPCLFLKPKKVVHLVHHIWSHKSMLYKLFKWNMKGARIVPPTLAINLH